MSNINECTKFEDNQSKKFGLRVPTSFNKSRVPVNGALCQQTECF